MDTKSFARVEIKDAEQGLVSAVFSTFDVVDLDRDIVVKSAIKNGTVVVIGGYNHTSWGGEGLPIGKGVIRTTDNEAILDGQFFLDTTHGADAWATIKALSEDDLQEWSYSLENIKSHRETIDGGSVRVIESVDIKEVCPVIRGASINTRTLAVKSGDDSNNGDDSATLSHKFSERSDAALRGVKQLVEMAVERLAHRAAEGKTTVEQVDVYDRLCAELVPLKSAIDATNPSDDHRAALDAEWLRFVANSQGVPQ